MDAREERAERRPRPLLLELMSAGYYTFLFLKKFDAGFGCINENVPRRIVDHQHVVWISRPSRRKENTR